MNLSTKKQLLPEVGDGHKMVGEECRITQPWNREKATNAILILSNTSAD
jgi:hypothetical protein